MGYALQVFIWYRGRFMFLGWHYAEVISVLSHNRGDFCVSLSVHWPPCQCYRLFSLPSPIYRQLSELLRSAALVSWILLLWNIVNCLSLVYSFLLRMVSSVTSVLNFVYVRPLVGFLSHDQGGYNIELIIISLGRSIILWKALCSIMQLFGWDFRAPQRYTTSLLNMGNVDTVKHPTQVFPWSTHQCGRNT